MSIRWHGWSSVLWLSWLSASILHQKIRGCITPYSQLPVGGSLRESERHTGSFRNKTQWWIRWYRSLCPVHAALSSYHDRAGCPDRAVQPTQRGKSCARSSRKPNPPAILLRSPSETLTFQKVNDTYGHECGDAVLKNVSALLKQHMWRRGFAARWGGEEFLLVFENVDLAEARKQLELLMDKSTNWIRSMKVNTWR